MTTRYDDDRTVIPSSERNKAFDEPAHALPAGTQLAEFSVLSVIGKGGFGIVYFAYDHSLRRQVAIKEYMPSELAERTRALTVSVRSERHAETFAAGLRSFINEARLLAQFDHPCLLKVYRFWEANGTAYMAMPYHAGLTLERTLRQRQSPPDEAWLRDLLRHLLSALEQMHEARCYHRDISPDNILIQPDGRPLLLDFGAARHVIGDMQRALTVILKTGYAPVEQYGDVPDMPDLKQGAWTDLYALGAVMYHAITGQTPPPAVQRLLEDKYVPLAQWAATRYSQSFLCAIDRALAVRPKNRPQSSAEMLALLGPVEPTPGPRLVLPTALASGPVPGPVPGPAPEPAPRPTAQPQPAAVEASAMREPTREVPMTSAAPEPSFAANTASAAAAAAQVDVMEPTRAPAAFAPERRSGRRKLAWASTAVAAAVAASVGFVYLLVAYTDSATEAARVQHRTSGSVAVQAAQTNDAGAVSPTTDLPPTDAASAPFAPAELPATSAGPTAETAPAPTDQPAAAQRPNTAPRVAARAPPSARPPERRVVNDKPSLSRRCVDIIQRVSLGEPLTTEERDVLKQECGQ